MNQNINNCFMELNESEMMENNGGVVLEIIGAVFTIGAFAWAAYDTAITNSQEKGKQKAYQDMATR